MTKEEAGQILAICRNHDLPKPQRRPGYRFSEYELIWTGKGNRVKLASYSAAYYFCRALYLEQKERRL